METTPCGLLKFNELDTYNYSDAKINFDRPDELLSRLGAHESRFFVYNTAASAGAVVNSDWTVTSFVLRGMGEWFYISVVATPKATMSRSGSKQILSLPARFAAIHTQKLTSVTTGRGARGWISSSAQVYLGTTSGTDANLSAGESIQLSGWYLPVNDLRTVGISSVGEKAPFFSNYLTSLDIIDDACKKANTALPRDTKEAYLVLNGNTALDGGSLIFTVDSVNFSINSVRFTRFNDFAFIGLNLKSKKAIPIQADGRIASTRMGTINHYGSRAYASQPLEPANTGRLSYSYIGAPDNEIKLTAIGRAGTGTSYQIGIGEDISVAGYYRLAEAQGV